MPLGDDALGSPSGDNRWTGVALALFVRNEALGGTNRSTPAAVPASTPSTR
jgi:hypothetical protein